MVEKNLERCSLAYTWRMRVSRKRFLRLKERNVLESRFIRGEQRGRSSRRPFVVSSGGRSAELASDVEEAGFRPARTRSEARVRLRLKIYVAEEHVRPEARKLRQPLPLTEGKVGGLETVPPSSDKRLSAR